MRFSISPFLFLTILLLNTSEILAANVFGSGAQRPKRPIKIVIDDPFAPRPGLDDRGAEEDEDELFNAESGSCRECGPRLRSPLGAGDSMVKLTTAALVRSAYRSYSDSSEILAMIEAARSHIEENPNRYIGWRRVKGKLKKTTFCYRAVKDAMKAAGVVNTDFIGGAEARFAVTELTAAGFRNLLDDENVNEILRNSPEMAPKGAILVYDTVPRSGPSPAGHIEIKTEESGDDGYISVSETNAPTYGYAIPGQRRLIGVMMKNQTKI